MKWIFLLCLFITTPLHDKPVEQDMKSIPCLAYTIFHEANLEPLDGQRAVYDVILERMKRSGKTACEVVLVPKQFSNLTQRKIDTTSKEMLANFWKMLYNTGSSCNGCTHFVRKDVQVAWMKKFKFRKRVGNHLFFEEKL